MKIISVSFTRVCEKSSNKIGKRLSKIINRQLSKRNLINFNDLTGNGWDTSGDGWKFDGYDIPTKVEYDGISEYIVPKEGIYMLNGHVIHMKPGDIVKLNSEMVPYIQP